VFIQQGQLAVRPSSKNKRRVSVRKARKVLWKQGVSAAGQGREGTFDTKRPITFNKERKMVRPIRKGNKERGEKRRLNRNAKRGGPISSQAQY